VLQQQPECVCKSSSSLPPLSFHKPVGDHRTLKHLGQAGFKGRAQLFLVSKLNLNLFYSCIWHIKNHKKWNKIEKVMTSQNRRVKNSKKTNH
jgi:hypothetical protein